MLVVLFFYIVDTAKQGYYKWVPDFVAGSPALVPWVQAGRVVVFAVIIFGTVQTYASIKKSYAIENERKMKFQFVNKEGRLCQVEHCSLRYWLG